MKTFVSALYRDLTCAAAPAAITLLIAVTFVHSTSVPPAMQASSSVAAVLITLLLGVTFAQSTSASPAAHAGGRVFVAVRPEDAGFGQPEPALLVD